jgi:hypothetical protein
MSRVTLGVVMGLVIGAIEVAIMIPIKMPDKRTSMLGAFFSRFALGFFAATAQLPLPAAVSGIVVGILTSLPDAVLTKAYGPVMVTGVVFGAAAGWIAGRF